MLIKKIFILIILLIISLCSVSALSTINSDGEQIPCRDYSGWLFYDYDLEYYTEDIWDYYKVVKSDEKILEDYKEPYGYMQYPDSTTRSENWKKHYEEMLDKLTPREGTYPASEGITLAKAAGEIANQKEFLDYFVSDPNCVPCDGDCQSQKDSEESNEKEPEQDLNDDQDYNEITGCMDSNAKNYNSKATTPGSCEYYDKTCDENTRFDVITKKCINPCLDFQKLVKKDKDDIVGHCVDKCNDDEEFDDETSKCISLLDESKKGCTDIDASNYDEFATIDDGSCKECRDGYNLVKGLFGNKCIKCNSGRTFDGDKCSECADNQLDQYNSEYKEETIKQGDDYITKEFGTKHVDYSCRNNPCYDILKDYKNQDNEADTNNDEMVHKSAGSITYKTGRVLIERGIDIVPGLVGTELYPGDTIVVEESSEAAISLNNQGLIKVSQKTKYMIPTTPNKKTKKNKISAYLAYSWCKFKNALQGESTPSETAGGVRG